MMGGRKRKFSHYLDGTSKDNEEERKPSRPVDLVYRTTEILALIVSVIPSDQISSVRKASRRFRDVVEIAGVREKIHGVPSKSKAGTKVLSFRGEEIATYVRSIKQGSLPSGKQHYASCIQGYGGERFLDRNDPAFKNLISEDIDMILLNNLCSEPCVIDSRRLAFCNLNPGPFKRILCTILARAWEITTVYKDNFRGVMQPFHFDITCDAKPISNLAWGDWDLRGYFSSPPPQNTFEATVNWVFDLLYRFAEERSRLFLDHRNPSIEHLDHVKCIMVSPQEVQDAFRVARSTTWSLEQICYIVNRIPERSYLD